MTKNLVVVESPAKARTIKQYLGGDCEVLASYGHVRDLPPKQGSVKPDGHFAMTYQTIERNAKHLDIIAKALRRADALFLATDPDREGEAISWHVQQVMLERKLLKDKPCHRIVFNEITKNAVRDAMSHPRDIAMDLVNAQQARRALDYLVGFNLSPLLWKKVRRGLSAGRVQSPALRMIVEREEAIEAFKPQEYWKVTAHLIKDGIAFDAKLTHFQGEKLTQFGINQQQQAEQVHSALVEAAQGHLQVGDIDKKQRKRHPAPPFITSTLQQEAARKLGYTARKTMSLAQQLYEGIDVGGGATQGLITYMRTDSVSLASEAVNSIRILIEQRYGQKALPDAPRLFKTKSKNAQEAHEAIRPTDIFQLPEKIKSSMTVDQFKLYELIWKRSVACQMIHALIDTVAVDLACGKIGKFRANGNAIKDPGFMAVYLEGQDDNKQKEDNQETLLPPLEPQELVPLSSIQPSQHFTEPPPRYSEASLVKALEEHDIGRPSTYATIIQTLQQREYVYLEKKRFYPTDVGRVVNRFLTQHFTKYVDYDFTANLEASLDQIARGEQAWVPVLEHFWTPFIQRIEHIDQSVQRKDVTTERTDQTCPECNHPLAIRLGKRGRFIGCTNYPDCSYTASLDGTSSAEEQTTIEGRACPECRSTLLIKQGKYGRFIGCSGYPNCRHIEPLEKPTDTGVGCPKCQQGQLLQRKSRKGKIFFSCKRYPDCDYALWNMPVASACPSCHWPIITVKETKTSGKTWLCPQKGCDFKTNADPLVDE